MPIFRARAVSRSASRIFFGILLLAAVAWGAEYLRQGWESIWQKESAATRHPQTYVAIDPALARDPSVQAAKLKVIGPLASVAQPSADTDNPNSDENTESIAEPQPASALSAAPHPSAALSHADLAKRFQHLAPVRLFHGKMFVKGYRDLQFEVPAYASFPRVTGSYRMLGDAQSRNTGVLLLTDRQYREFLQGTLGDPASSSEAPSGMLDVALTPTRSEAEKYHLLLRGTARGVTVQADFAVSFE